MKISKPAYFDQFRCIASACPDSCCKEWEVDVDADAEHLLPYLTASIAWADSEPELAEQYKGFFEDHLPALRAKAAARAATRGLSASYSSPWLIGVR